MDTYCADLSKRDLRGEALHHKILMNANLAFSILPDNMSGANLCGADLSGARIALQCSTFKDVAIDAPNVLSLLYMLTLLRVLGRVDKADVHDMIFRLKLLEKAGSTSWQSIIKAIIPPEAYAKIAAMARQ